MIHEYNVLLSKMTTFKMGGIAKNLYVPENENELCELIKLLNNNVRLIGGGSNLLINDRCVIENVVSLKQFNQSIVFDNNQWVVGASVRLQTLINTINNVGKGGIEYLYSVPGLVGGAVVMNAGRGIEYKQTISDYIKEVVVFDGLNIKRYTKSECCFSHRTSRFKSSKEIILSVVFEFPDQDIMVSNQLKEERKKLVKQFQDNSAPNFGSVFSVVDLNILKRVVFISSFSFKKVKFSKKTLNWMLNYGGKYKDAIYLIEKVKKEHRRFGKECKIEVIIWK